MLMVGSQEVFLLVLERNCFKFENFNSKFKHISH
jgi:hypothetical protein